MSQSTVVNRPNFETHCSTVRLEVGPIGNSALRHSGLFSPTDFGGPATVYPRAGPESVRRSWMRFLDSCLIGGLGVELAAPNLAVETVPVVLQFELTPGTCSCRK